MPSNKNQHFVPKCYLRPFSSDGSSGSVNLFNLTQRRAIRGASIKGQCSSHYFYGQDSKLEEALQISERNYASFLRRLIEPNYRLTGDHFEMLRLFCLLQYCRTDAHARRNLAFLSGMTDVAFNGSTPAEYRTTTKDVVQIAMRTFAESMSIVRDLKVKLVRNRTRIDFVTSDNPSIHTNRWHLQNPRARHQTPGVANAGVLFLLPLTPRFLCVVYDGDVYTIENHNDWVDLDRTDEIKSLNEHQFLNCQSNIYFSNWQSADEVHQAYSSVYGLRPTSRHEIITAVLDKEDGWGKRYKVVPMGNIEGKEGLIHIKEVLPVPTRWPRFLRIRTDAKIYSNNTGTGFVRAWSIEQGRYSGTGYRRI